VVTSVDETLHGVRPRPRIGSRYSLSRPVEVFSHFLHLTCIYQGLSVEGVRSRKSVCLSDVHNNREEKDDEKEEGEGKNRQFLWTIRWMMRM